MMADVPKNPRRWPQILWLDFPGEGLPVTMPALKSQPTLRWRKIYGIQIGRWFLGAIEGGPGSAWEGETPTADPRSYDAAEGA